MGLEPILSDHESDDLTKINLLPFYSFEYKQINYKSFWNNTRYVKRFKTKLGSIE